MERRLENRKVISLSLSSVPALLLLCVLLDYLLFLLDLAWILDFRLCLLPVGIVCLCWTAFPGLLSACLTIHRPQTDFRPASHQPESRPASLQPSPQLAAQSVRPGFVNLQPACPESSPAPNPYLGIRLALGGPCSHQLSFWPASYQPSLQPASFQPEPQPFLSWSHLVESPPEGRVAPTDIVPLCCPAAHPHRCPAARPHHCPAPRPHHRGSAAQRHRESAAS
ncbi:LIM domain-binding protein 3-like isoform X2 [Siniperca chuatsi]|uniref:LIM domain-binding protein 3-like isoform X2 n=1 Tax=Siniperca chuatsi TaxID=119488 RepID=UPI001CE1D3C7|nr:LIM domain-binding protein 3-like isoform X2 [Siniperca chuatsi]